MFIATQATTSELRQDFHVYSNTGDDKRTPSGVPTAAGKHHLTPDGVSGLLHAITINIALLTEGYHASSEGLPLCRGGVNKRKTNLINFNATFACSRDTIDFHVLHSTSMSGNGCEARE